MDVHQRKIRPCYEAAMSEGTAARIKEDLGQEDRYDLSCELSFGRLYISSLLRMREQALTRYADKPEVIRAIESELAQASQYQAKTAKLVREVEHAGQTFSPAEVGMLVEKICSLLMFHIADLQNREAAIEDIMDLCKDFVKPQAQGTLITPDQDAQLMDATVPVYTDDEPFILTIDGPPPEDL